MCDDCPYCKVEISAGKTANKGEFGFSNKNRNKSCRPKEDNNDLYGYDSVDHGSPSINSIQIPEQINSSIEVLPMKLIQMLEDSGNWSRKASCNKKKMARTEEEHAQHLYAKIHQVPRLYRNLYFYFFVRCDSLKALHQYTSKFREWELEFHNEEPLEALNFMLQFVII